MEWSGILRVLLFWRRKRKKMLEFLGEKYEIRKVGWDALTKSSRIEDKQTPMHERSSSTTAPTTPAQQAHVARSSNLEDHFLYCPGEDTQSILQLFAALALPANQPTELKSARCVNGGVGHRTQERHQHHKHNRWGLKLDRVLGTCRSTCC